MSRSSSGSQSNLGASGSTPESRCDPHSPTTRLYEVLYVGKVGVTTKSAPPTFIDDAVKTFDKAKHQSYSGTCGVAVRQQVPGTYDTSLPVEVPQPARHPPTKGSKADVALSRGSHDNILTRRPSDDTTGHSPGSRRSSNDGSAEIGEVTVDGVRYLKTGAASGLDVSTLNRNRTMLIQVGETDLALISLDGMSIILECKFTDISFCSQVWIRMIEGLLLRNILTKCKW